MHIYNITFGVEPEIEDELIGWLRSEFIPASTADGEYFTAPELMRVLNNELQVNSLALHMRADNLDDIAKWYEDHGAALFDYAQKRWNGRVVFFTTTLSLI